MTYLCTHAHIYRLPCSNESLLFYHSYALIPHHEWHFQLCTLRQMVLPFLCLISFGTHSSYAFQMPQSMFPVSQFCPSLHTTLCQNCVCAIYSIRKWCPYFCNLYENYFSMPLLASTFCYSISLCQRDLNFWLNCIAIDVCIVIILPFQIIGLIQL